jgi:hypothetical protein
MNENHHACRNRKLNINRALPAWRAKTRSGAAPALVKFLIPGQSLCQAAIKMLQPAID